MRPPSYRVTGSQKQAEALIFCDWFLWFLCKNVFQDKKKVACRHDWHQTGNTVVVTIYAKNSNPDICSIEANQTVVSKTKDDAWFI